MLKCSHVLCKVDDLRATVRDYEELGFTVEWGSAPERAHNALIWFAEGPFIELFELPRAFAFLRWPLGAVFGAAAGARLARWAGPGEGWRDLALETADTDLAGVRSALRGAGVPVSRVMKGRRTRPDGGPVRYQFLAPRPAALPFVVSAYDPPQRPARIVHPNGARGIARVRMGVAEADRPFYDALIGEDRWLAAEPAARTGVLGVAVAGLESEPDPAKLHGAQLTAATRKDV
ncbi:VOC family protein [Streptomyces sp. XD-27]|uniref:VOC family protein n=1 Tax=Streptomyces sp. XD-27 TaxID=3062779 RepID=UPI0026F41BA3|nr:VOC family protein [Streptomyces sp. XD-27]WKX69038.1 VOC family protein [Streptomyces sp. XD-27]